MTGGRTEPERLLSAGEYRAALIAATSLLENALNRFFGAGDASAIRRMPLTQSVDHAAREGLIKDSELEALSESIRLRNAALHQNAEVTEPQASQAVTAILAFLRRMKPSRP